MLFTGNRFDKHPGKTVIDITATNRSPFAPSFGLLHDIKAGRIDWAEYERRYVEEARNWYRMNPQLFHDLIDQAHKSDIVLVCYERGNEREVECHRRLLADILRKIAAKHNIVI